MSEPTIYECVSDRYDAWPGQHYTLQGFQQMCVACFEEKAKLTRDGGDWKDETGQVVLREVRSSLPSGVPVVVSAGQMNPKADPWAWGPWIARMNDAASAWEDGRLDLSDHYVADGEDDIEKLTIDLTLESLMSLVRALEAAVRQAEAKVRTDKSTYDDRLRKMFTKTDRFPLNLNDYWSAPSGGGPLGAAWNNKPHRLLYDLIGEIVRLTEAEGCKVGSGQGRTSSRLSPGNLCGNLCDYNTAETIRPATAEERAESLEAARHDGGAGVIRVDGRSCYVED